MTRIEALMWEWMSQNTFTRPGLLKRCPRVSPRGYRPRLNAAVDDSENTLWKNGSALGKSTVDPFVIASTCGTNVSSSCRSSDFVVFSVPRNAGSFRYRTTLRISGMVGPACLPMVLDG